MHLTLAFATTPLTPLSVPVLLSDLTAAEIKHWQEMNLILFPLSPLVSNYSHKYTSDHEGLADRVKQTSSHVTAVGKIVISVLGSAHYIAGMEEPPITRCIWVCWSTRFADKSLLFGA